MLLLKPIAEKAKAVGERIVTEIFIESIEVRQVLKLKALQIKLAKLFNKYVLQLLI